MKAFRVLCCLLVVAVIVSIGILTADLHAGLQHLDATTLHFDDFVSDASIDYAMKAEEVNHILLAARVTADQAGMLAIEQRYQLRKTSADSDKSVKALRLVLDRAGLLFKHTDEQLNDRSLPAITASAQINMKLIGDNAAAIGDSARALTAIVSDPRTGSILANFDSASGHFNVIAGNFEAMSNDMKPAVHRLAAPPSKLHSFLDVTYTGLKFGSLFVP
jgi:hypothetical protein